MDHVLKRYFKENNVTAASFCRKVGITNPYLQFIYHRKRYPSRELCIKIYDFTNGQIDPMTLFDMEVKKTGKKK